MAIITLTAADGSEVQFYDELKAAGAMKDVYFSLNRDYVVAFYRNPADAAVEERLSVITGIYRERIFNQAGGDYWKKVFCWPTTTVKYREYIGVVVPCYSDDFFFKFFIRFRKSSNISKKSEIDIISVFSFVLC